MNPQQRTFTVQHPSTTTTVELVGKCDWCNGYHSGRCPKIKAIEYHPNGTIKRVEFK